MLDSQLDTMLNKLGYQDSLNLLHALIDMRGNYDNNISCDELYMLNFLKDWYSNNHNEV
jgi:hypothetical protein